MMLKSHLSSNRTLGNTRLTVVLGHNAVPTVAGMLA